MQNSVDRKFSEWIFNSFSISLEGLGLYRIFTAAFILFFLLPNINMYSFLGSLPDVFFEAPPGLMQFFTGFPPEGLFLSLHAALIISLIFLMLGLKTRITSIATGILILLIKGFFYSFGKINHDLLLAVVPLLMAFSSWGSCYSIDEYLGICKKNKHESEGWLLTLLALIIGFMMFTAGFPKILGGWLDVQTQATYGHLIKQYFVNGRQDLLAGQALNMDNIYIWESVDYFTVLFEIGFLFSVVNPKSTRLFISLAVIFHFSVMMLLNISFLVNYIAYAAFLDWTNIHNKIKKSLDIRFGPVLFLMGCFISVISLVFITEYFGLFQFKSEIKVSHFYILIISLPISIWYLINFIKSASES